MDNYTNFIRKHKSNYRQNVKYEKKYNNIQITIPLNIKINKLYYYYVNRNIYVSDNYDYAVFAQQLKEIYDGL